MKKNFLIINGYKYMKISLFLLVIKCKLKERIIS